LDISVSGTNVSGTWSVYQDTGPTTVDVDGTFDGTTFMMTAYLDRDCVSYMQGMYTLTVDGDLMTSYNPTPCMDRPTP